MKGESEWEKAWNKSCQYLGQNIPEGNHKAQSGEHDGSFKGSKEATMSVVVWVTRGVVEDTVSEVAGVLVTQGLANHS